MSPAPWRLCALMAALLLVSPSLLTAQTWGQVGERAQGMGGAFVAVADDASAIYWNPGGLATGSTFDAQIDLSTPKSTLDAPTAGQHAFVAASLPVLALAYYGIRSAVSTSADRKNGGSGEVRVSALDTRNVGVSLVQTIVNTLVIGSTLRLVNGAGKTSFDLDLGTMASVGDVRVGVTARNLRKGIDTERQVRLGAAFVPRSRPTGVLGPFSAAFDIDLTRTATIFGDERQAAIGSEQWWAKGLVGTRFGVHWNTIRGGEKAVAGGFTVKLPRSLFAEGHVTKSQQDRESDWGGGLRVTF
jgi:hypothetical protein